jgi:hypothetical protein
MLDVLQAVDARLEEADTALIETLAALEGNTVRWPTDDELRADLEVRALYGQGRVARAAILTALRLVENEWRRPKGESRLGADSDLQIEHLLPQDWAQYWPVATEPEDTANEREQVRTSHVHRLGNLTLVSPSMNPSISNREWEHKRGDLREHSNLLITQRYLDRECWDETAIRDRGTALVSAIIEIWPGPTGVFDKPREY